MIPMNLQEQIIEKLATLHTNELDAVLRYIQVVESARLPPDYDEDHDPTVGFFSAEPDFASRTREILAAGFGKPRNSEPV
jgi:hypothetical protein